MAVLTAIVEGQTGRLTFTLQEDGEAINGTSLTVSDCLVTGRDGTEVTTTGDFGWVSQSAGTVYLDADASDFVASKSPYAIRFKLTDGDGRIRYYPGGATDHIVVHPVR